MSSSKPTNPERIALERIEAIRARSPFEALALLGLFPLLQLLPERHSALAAMLSVVLVLGMVATLVHRTCFLRCPRCSGWIVIPKCPACGLKLDKPGSTRS